MLELGRWFVVVVFVKEFHKGSFFTNLIVHLFFFIKDLVPELLKGVHSCIYGDCSEQGYKAVRQRQIFERQREKRTFCTQKQKESKYYILSR